MHDAVGALDGPRHDHRIRDGAEDIGDAVDAGGTPLQGAHLVSSRDQRCRDGAAQEAGRASDRDDHG